MRVRSLRLHSYAGSNYRSGSEYEITNARDLKILIAVKAVCPVGVAFESPKEIEQKPKKKRLKVKKNIKKEQVSQSKKSLTSRYERKDLRVADADEQRPSLFYEGPLESDDFE